MWSVVFFLGLIQGAVQVAGAIRIEKTGGGAGAVVAARLSEIPEWKVLLLEAGPDEPAGAAIPANSRLFLGTEIDWQYRTTNESNACLIANGSCNWPRGKNLGGTTVHHGMLYHRGNPRDYANWVEMGADGWSPGDVLPFYLKSENNQEIGRVSGEYHAIGGEMTVERFPWQPPFVQAVLEAAEETGYGLTEDVNGPDILGFTVAQTMSKNGVRQSSATAFLRPIRHRKNLDIALNATVTKIIVRNKIARGVEYIINGETRTARVRREIVVSGGTINSPQLLLLSGIGPAEDLQKIGIPVVHDLPGVGKNLHNHLSYPLDFTINEPPLTSYSYDDVYQYLLTQTGPLSSIGMAQMTGMIASKYTTPDWPDIQIFFVGYKESCQASSTSNVDFSATGNSIRFTADNIHTKSRGVISLASKNPLEHPIIWSNDLGDHRDMDVMIEALHVLQNLGNSSVMQAKGLTLTTKPLKQCSQYEFLTDDYFRCSVRWDTRGENHQAGTCKMGAVSDPMAVVDPQLRVYGIKGLRVADASIMPQVTSGNTHAPSMMIGERAADFIKKTYNKC